MAYSPIFLAPPQFKATATTFASGYVLKAFQAGTTNTQQMATDQAGGTLVNSITLDSNGYPSYGGSVVLPHIDDTVSYKLALFASAEAAEAGTPAVWSIDTNTPILLDPTFATEDATNNGVTTVGTYAHTTTGTPAAGIGTGIGLITETGGGNHTGMVLASIATNVTDGVEDFDFVVQLISDGAAAAEALRVTDTGVLRPVGGILFQSANPTILGNDADGTVSLGPSTTANLGGNAIFYGQSHSTKAGDIELRNTTTVVGGYDHSATQWLYEYPLLIKESAAATGDVAGYGQFWVKNDTPCAPRFTDDAGTDRQLATLDGTEALTNKTYSGTLLNVPDTIYAISDGGSVDIDPANGRIQTWTLGANRTPTATSFANGQSVTLFIDDGTAYTVTWTTIGVTWLNNGGSAPALATSGYTAITLMKIGGTVYGFLAGNGT